MVTIAWQIERVARTNRSEAPERRIGGALHMITLIAAPLIERRQQLATMLRSLFRDMMPDHSCPS